ncbi:MAG: hypothetical protein GKR94_27305 [Gammaproteobacteria bacterium]|nr:hypothetical protein [Gammaproteobacteria bacterium]
MTFALPCRGNIALIVLVLLAGASIHVMQNWQTLRGYIVPDVELLAVAQAGGGDTVDPLVIAAVPTLDELVITRARPLFTPSRKPYVPPAKPKPPARNKNIVIEQAQAPLVRRYDFRLSAIWVIDGVPVALMRDPKTGADVRLKEDEAILDWMVREITDSTVTLVNGEEEDVVELRQFSADSGPTTTPARPARTTAAARPAATPERVRRPRRALQGPRRTNRNRQLRNAQ